MTLSLKLATWGFLKWSQELELLQKMSSPLIFFGQIIMYTYARGGFPLSLSWEEVKDYIQEKLEQCKIRDIMKNLAPNRKHSIFNTIPGVLWFMGSQRVGNDWATELNWTELKWSWTLVHVFIVLYFIAFSLPWNVFLSLFPATLESLIFFKLICWSYLNTYSIYCSITCIRIANIFLQSVPNVIQV